MSALIISFHLLITKCHIKPALVKLSLQALKLTIIQFNSECVKAAKSKMLGLILNHITPKQTYKTETQISSNINKLSCVSYQMSVSKQEDVLLGIFSIGHHSVGYIIISIKQCPFGSKGRENINVW